MNKINKLLVGLTLGSLAYSANLIYQTSRLLEHSRILGESKAVLKSTRGWYENQKEFVNYYHENCEPGPIEFPFLSTYPIQPTPRDTHKMEKVICDLEILELAQKYIENYERVIEITEDLDELLEQKRRKFMLGM